jgi:hypothetical protein
MTKINFTGNIDDIKKQIEQSVATFELVGNESSVNFEQWFEGWEKGFPEDVENRSLGNYPPTGENAWRKDASKWPRWRQWSVGNNGIIKGEYWRDRSQEKDSIPLSGTSEQLIDQIIKLEFPSAVANQNKSKSQEWPPMSGQPQIRLFFKGDNKAEAETSFRIMNRTDNPKIPLPIIDKNDLRKYAEKIRQEFGTPLYVWEKGREAFSYNNPWQGFQGQWWLCRNEAIGRGLLVKLLAIQDLSLDNTKTRISKAIDENLAFPSNPPPVTVLGEPMPQDVERPLVDVSFYRAEIKLAKMRSPISLVERGLVVYT